MILYGAPAKPEGNAQGIPAHSAMASLSRRGVTPAEVEVLRQLVRGLSNRSIAAELVLSHRTVESHISRLLAKTGCRSRTQLLLWALAER